MNDASIAALAAFLGAVVGSLLPLAFARSTAFDQAIGQESAKRRIDLIERINDVFGESLALMDGVNLDPVHGQVREAQAVLDEFVKLGQRAHLYFDDDLRLAIKEFSEWIHYQIELGDAAQPDQARMHKVRRMLGEAIEGEHTRVRPPWYRRF